MNEVIPFQKSGLLEQMAARYGLAPDIYERTVAAVAMPQKSGKPDCTREELISCLVVANEHNLNPLTKEIYFMRTRAGMIQPIVSVDGWVKKLNEHPQFDGLEFEDDFDDKGNIRSVTCIIHRKDRSKPIRITEYLDECQQDSGPWKKTKKRMLRHRALTQGARYAVGFAGVMDRDEFEQWQGMDAARDITPVPPVSAVPDIPDIPDIPDVEADETYSADAVLSELEESLERATSLADVLATEREFGPALMNMDDDYRDSGVEMIEAAKASMKAEAAE